MQASLAHLKQFDHVADAVSYLNQLKVTPAVKIAAQLDSSELIQLLENPELKHNDALLAHLTMRVEPIFWTSSLKTAWLTF